MKVTQKQYKYFEERVRHWFKYYSLTSYDLEVLQERLDPTTFAECRFYYPGRDILIVVTDEFVEPYPSNINKYLDKIAHHETVEAMLSKFRTLVANQQQEEVDDACHAVIHSLWNATLK